MKPTILIDEMHGSTAAIEITFSPKYRKLLGLVDVARRALLNNANLRRPYVELLCSVYEKGSRTIKPTDEDILQHIEERFPAIVLAEPPPSDGPFIWGLTWAGIDTVDDEKIYLNGDVVNFWLGRSRKKRMSAAKFNLVITSTLFHELAHYLMRWWSQGHCRTPVIEPVTKEGGNFIERQIFGGAVMGWWKENEIGHFSRLREIGVVTCSVPKFFNHKTVVECEKKLGDRDATLPFITLESQPDSRSKIGRLVHAKLNADLREIKRIKRMLKPYESQDAEAGLGLIGVPLHTNDTFIHMNNSH